MYSGLESNWTCYTITLLRNCQKGHRGFLQVALVTLVDSFAGLLPLRHLCSCGLDICVCVLRGYAGQIATRTAAGYGQTVKHPGEHWELIQTKGPKSRSTLTLTQLNSYTPRGTLEYIDLDMPVGHSLQGVWDINRVWLTGLPVSHA